MGLRWDDERKEFPPLKPWQHAIVWFAVGFVACLMMFVIK